MFAVCFFFVCFVCFKFLLLRFTSSQQALEWSSSSASSASEISLLISPPPPTRFTLLPRASSWPHVQWHLLFSFGTHLEWLQKRNLNVFPLTLNTRLEVYSTTSITSPVCHIFTFQTFQSNTPWSPFLRPSALFWHSGFSPLALTWVFDASRRLSVCFQVFHCLV